MTWPDAICTPCRRIAARRVLMRFAARACMMRLSAPTISRRELTSGISMLDSRGRGWPRGPWGAPVEVTEGAAAHGGRFAVESTGHDVSAFFELGHEACSCWHFGNGVPLLPSPQGVNGQFSCFLRVMGQGSPRKSAVLRNFKAEIFKTEILQTVTRTLMPGATAWARRACLLSTQE